MKIILKAIIPILLLAACSADEPATDNSEIKFVVEHPYVLTTRATATQFELSDRIGVYAVESGKELEISGNVINNAMLTYDGSSWHPNRSMFWNERIYDFYAYYPYQEEINSIEDMYFEVSADQSATSNEKGYEASDLLYATVKNLSASDEAVHLQFRHAMSRLIVRLVKGEDYEGSLPDNAEVYIHNTITQSSVDLKSGIVTNSIKGTRNTITARNEGNQMYSAIIVPQRIVNRVPLVEVVVNGVSYLYEGTMIFKSGTQHLINLIIDRNPHQAVISIGGEQVNW